MSDPLFKVAYVPWWKPIRLAKRNAVGGWDFVGWVWRQRAYLVNNTAHGWIAFAEDQTPENIDVWFCPHCQASLRGGTRAKLLSAIHGEGRAAASLGEKM
ncbi:hypothetical protein [Hydrogenophaga laconesensis]|uniref:Uncharacterized protein n=1 Tax=Hydrogenophaga laconesensis TaxID=1805971 RepID=A0ABU1V4G7_9BURK|nr:hypothetical protein [Hydrogenophaga laconesensis]MDR7092290.1 hypothetical protein [Hydrogenophaga laconesensis]